MKTRSIPRALTVALLSAGFVVAVGGCSATRKMAATQPGGTDQPLAKEYQWKDMSLGKSFFGSPRVNPSTQSASSTPKPLTTPGN